MVVGAGPVGLTAVALLGARGVPVVLVERHPEPYALPRAVHLDDEVMRVLQQVGVTADLPTHPSRGLRLLDPQHHVLAQFDRGDGVHGHPQASMLDQPDLERLLRQRVATLPGVEVVTGVAVVGLETPASPVVVLSSGRRVRAAAVLGCDGAGSDVRTAIGSSLVVLGRADRWHVLDVRCAVPVTAWDGVHQVCDPARPATFMRLGPDRYRVEVRGEPEPLERLLRPWLPADVEVLRSADYTYRACVADRWRVGRVVLVGDAAHLSPPFVGQGLGLGLRDAANLVWKLAAVLGGAPEDLLDSYQAEREPHARALIRTAQVVGLAMTGGGRGADAARAVLLGALDRVPRLTTSALDRGSPPLRPGPLVPRHRLAGHLVPQPRVRGRLLDDLLGDGWAVLADGPAGDLADLPVRQVRVDLCGSPGLASWLRRHRCGAVLVRPDRVVLAATDRAGRLRRGGATAVDRVRRAL